MKIILRQVPIFIIIIALWILAGCAGMKKAPVADITGRQLKIKFSFNTESYPWVLKTAYPQMTIWVESKDTPPKTVFVTEGAGQKKWLFADERPGALPVWGGTRSQEKNIQIDAVSGATPVGDTHTISWQVPDIYLGKNITIFIEANVSFDYNEYYTKDENTPGYSSVNGQPSILYQARCQIDKESKDIVPDIIGHGNVLGTDNNIDPDMSHITTARGLFNYVKIHYKPKS